MYTSAFFYASITMLEAMKIERKYYSKKSPLSLKTTGLSYSISDAVTYRLISLQDQATES